MSQVPDALASMYRVGFVSVWLGLQNRVYLEGTRVLTDLCGLESYDSDAGEGYASHNGEPIAVADLILLLSSGRSFVDEVVKAAQRLGITEAVWSVIQFDMAYDPSLIARPVSDEPKFIGFFPYVADELPDWAR